MKTPWDKAKNQQKAKLKNGEYCSFDGKLFIIRYFQSMSNEFLIN